MSIENEKLEFVHDAFLRVTDDTFSGHGDLIGEAPFEVEHPRSHAMYAQRAARIVACVNAFAGVPTEEIFEYQTTIERLKVTFAERKTYCEKFGVHFRDCQCDQCTSMIKGR